MTPKAKAKLTEYYTRFLAIHTEMYKAEFGDEPPVDTDELEDHAESLTAEIEQLVHQYPWQNMDTAVAYFASIIRQRDIVEYVIMFRNALNNLEKGN